ESCETRVLRAMVPDVPFVSTKPGGHVHVSSTWLVPHAPAARASVGATGKPDEVKFSGSAGLSGSSRSRPGGRQSVIFGFVRSLADVAGTPAPISHETVCPGTVTFDDVRTLLKSTLIGTMVWVVHCRLLSAVPVAVMSTQLSNVEPATMG